MFSHTLSSRGALAAGTAIVAVGLVLVLPVLRDAQLPPVIPVGGDAAVSPPPEDHALEEAEVRLWEWVRWVEGELLGGADDPVEAMRDWVLGGYRALGYPEDLIRTYDLNTFWPMQVAGIQRWLDRRSG